MEISKEPKKEKSAIVESVPNWIWIILAVICLLILLAGWISSCNEKETPLTETQETADSRTSFREVLDLVDFSYVGPRMEWVTPFVDYKFKIRTEGHSINVQYTSINGGWTKKVLLPAEGDVDLKKNKTKRRNSGSA